jgi:Ca2+-binding EF-hand superfamily protein
LVDQIFHVFDTDKSGTMDFDEFAMWIMNSEFMKHPSRTDSAGATAKNKQIGKA